MGIISSAKTSSLEPVALWIRAAAVAGSWCIEFLSHCRRGRHARWLFGLLGMANAGLFANIAGSRIGAGMINDSS